MGGYLLSFVGSIYINQLPSLSTSSLTIRRREREKMAEDSGCLLDGEGERERRWRRRRKGGGRMSGCGWSGGKEGAGGGAAEVTA